MPKAILDEFLHVTENGVNSNFLIAEAILVFDFYLIFDCKTDRFVIG